LVRPVLVVVMDAVTELVKPYWQGLSFLGLLYLAKLTASLLCDLYDGVRAYLLPLVWRKNFVSEFGPWALVTGCTRGIGREYALGLASRGLGVVLVARDGGALEELALEVGRMGGRARVLVADFSQEGTVSRVVEQVKDLELGVLVNNVGIMGPHFMPFLDMDQRIIEEMVRINVATATQLCHTLLPAMVSRGRGAVVNISSIMAYQPMAYCSLYTATKYFLQGFTLSLAQELQGTGVVVQEVDPGHVDTRLTKHVIPATPVPFPSTFVSHALSTLGHSAHTCGWWGHSLHRVATDWLLPPRILPAMMRVMGWAQWRFALNSREKMQ